MYKPTKVFANTTWLHSKRVEKPKKRKMASDDSPDDVAALIADAEARGRIWHEDQVRGMTRGMGKGTDPEV